MATPTPTPESEEDRNARLRANYQSVLRSGTPTTTPTPTPESEEDRNARLRANYQSVLRSGTPTTTPARPSPTPGPAVSSTAPQQRVPEADGRGSFTPGSPRSALGYALGSPPVSWTLEKLRELNRPGEAYREAASSYEDPNLISRAVLDPYQPVPLFATGALAAKMDRGTAPAPVYKDTSKTILGGLFNVPFTGRPVRQPDGSSYSQDEAVGLGIGLTDPISLESKALVRALLAGNISPKEAGLRLQEQAEKRPLIQQLGSPSPLDIPLPAAGIAARSLKGIRNILGPLLRRGAEVPSTALAIREPVEAAAAEGLRRVPTPEELQMAGFGTPPPRVLTTPAPSPATPLPRVNQPFLPYGSDVWEPIPARRTTYTPGQAAQELGTVLPETPPPGAIPLGPSAAARAGDVAPTGARSADDLGGPLSKETLEADMTRLEPEEAWEAMSAKAGREPFDVYHGSKDAAFDISDIESSLPSYTGDIGEGIYFAPHPETAGIYGKNIYKTQLNVENPLIIDASNPGITYREVPELRGQSVLVGESMDPFDVSIDGVWHQVRNADDLSEIGNLARDAGHDAVFSRYLYITRTQDEILVLDPKVIQRPGVSAADTNIQRLEQELSEAQIQLEGLLETEKIVRPPPDAGFGVGWTNAELRRFAEHEGLDATDPSWYANIDPILKKRDIFWEANEVTQQTLKDNVRILKRDLEEAKAVQGAEQARKVEEALPVPEQLEHISTELDRLKVRLRSEQAELDNPVPYTMRESNRQLFGKPGYRPPPALTEAERLAGIRDAEDAVRVAKDNLSQLQQNMLTDPQSISAAKTALDDAESGLRGANKRSAGYSNKQRNYIADADELDEQHIASTKSAIQQTRNEIAALEARAAELSPTGARAADVPGAPTARAPGTGPAPADLLYQGRTGGTRELPTTQYRGGASGIPRLYRDAPVSQAPTDVPTTRIPTTEELQRASLGTGMRRVRAELPPDRYLGRPGFRSQPSARPRDPLTMGASDRPVSSLGPLSSPQRVPAPDIPLYDQAYALQEATRKFGTPAPRVTRTQAAQAASEAPDTAATIGRGGGEIPATVSPDQLQERITAALKIRNADERDLVLRELEGLVTDPLDAAVLSITRQVRNAAPISRQEIEKLRTVVRGQKVGRSAAILGRLTGQEAFGRSKAALAGALPDPKFTPPSITSDQLNLLTKRIQDDFKAGKLKFYTAQNTNDALKKLLGGNVPTRSELKLLENVFGSNLVDAYVKRTKTFRGEAVGFVVDALTISKSIRSSFDISFPFRQGFLLGARNPVDFTRAFRDMFKSFSPTKAREINEELFERARRLGLIDRGPGQTELFMPDVEGAAGITAELMKRDEAYLSRYAEKLPGVGMSQRAFNTFGNKLKVDVGEKAINNWIREGVDITPDRLDSLNRFLNVYTGRGSLGRLESVGDVLNIGFWSPRLFASRLQAPLLLADPAVRKMAAQNLAASFGLGVTILGLVKYSGAGDVELDPRSTDFGQIRIGRARINFWAGFQQIARYMAQIAVNQSKGRDTGDIIGGDQYPFVNRVDRITRLARSKIAPGFPVLVANELFTKSFLGEDLSERPDKGRAPGFIDDWLEKSGLDSVREWEAIQQVTPLVAIEIIDAISELGWAPGLAFGALPTVGIGTQIFNQPREEEAVAPTTGFGQPR